MPFVGQRLAGNCAECVAGEPPAVNPERRSALNGVVSAGDLRALLDNVEADSLVETKLSDSMTTLYVLLPDTERWFSRTKQATLHEG